MTERELTWSEITCVICTFVERQAVRSSVLRRELPGPVLAPHRPRPPLVDMGVTPAAGTLDRPVGVRVRARLDLFTSAARDPVAHAIEEGTTELRLDEAAWGSPPPMQRLAREILGHDEQLYIAGGVAALAGLEAPEPFICPTALHEDRHLVYWWTRFRCSGPPHQRLRAHAPAEPGT
jgi:hypothetical protein